MTPLLCTDWRAMHRALAADLEKGMISAEEIGRSHDTRLILLRRNGRVNELDEAGHEIGLLSEYVMTTAGATGFAPLMAEAWPLAGALAAALKISPETEEPEKYVAKLELSDDFLSLLNRLRSVNMQLSTLARDNAANQEAAQ